MDDKPPQSQPQFKLPAWMKWFPLPLLIFILLIPVIFLVKEGTWLLVIVALVLFVWGIIQVAVSEAVPLAIRARLAWLLPSLKRWQQLDRILFYGTLGVLDKFIAKFSSAEPNTETISEPSQPKPANNRVSQSLGFEILTFVIAVVAVFVGAIFVFVKPALGIPIVLAAIFVLSRLPILRKEYIVQEWSTLIVPGSELAETFFAMIEQEYQAYAVPEASGERKLVSPSFWSLVAAGLLLQEIRRPFFVLSLQTWSLKPYRLYFGAHPYGISLHLVCYMTMEVGFLRRLWALIPLLGRLAKVSVLPGGFVEPILNVFERQDLTAYATIGNHIWKRTVDELVLSLNQLPKEQKIHARGFLGIEE